MRAILLILVGLATAAHAAGARADCRAMEYAEIKDTKSKELAETYCYYDAVAAIHRKSQDDFQAEMLGKLKNEDRLPVINQIDRMLKSTADETSAKIDICRQQQAKIETALKARSFRGNRKCSSDATDPKP